MMWCVEDIKIVVLYINLQELGVLFTTGLNMDTKFFEAFTSPTARMYCLTMST